MPVCNQILSSMEKDSERSRGFMMDFHIIKDILRQEYVLSERNPKVRKKILDLIDLMLSKEVYGVNDIVSVHDRW